MTSNNSTCEHRIQWSCKSGLETKLYVTGPGREGYGVPDRPQLGRAICTPSHLGKGAATAEPENGRYKVWRGHWPKRFDREERGVRRTRTGEIGFVWERLGSTSEGLCSRG
jgi:hypothetical protein